jgi:predicted transposase YbfD/YdcC
VAIDGKTVRRSHDRNSGKRAIHLVSAWASANTLTPVSGTGQALGQVKTEEKSNEITAIPQLLQMLELKGCIVTIDAMGCQKEIAQGILDRGADYLLAVKENQGRLYDDVRDLFAGAEEFGYAGVPHDYATTLNKGHGRIERRECWAISDPLSLEYRSAGQSWPELRSVIKVVGHRDAGQGAAVQARYYISSLDSLAERLLAAIRAHWSIENSLHWSLDVTFGEDQCRVRKSLPS